MAHDLSDQVGAKIAKAYIPTYWQHNEIPGAALAVCGECNGQIQFHPRRLVWHHLDPELSPGCPDLDLRKRLTDEEVIQGIRGNGRPTVQALMQPQLDEWKRPDWIVMETIDEIDWSWIGRFGRGLAYGWIQVLAELYLPWIGLGCYKIHTLLRRNA